MPVNIQRVVVAFVLLAAAASALARQRPIESAPSSPTTAELPPLAKQTLERALAAYSALSTYQDRVEQQFVVTRKGAAKGEAVPEWESSVSLKFSRPNQFLVEMRDLTVLSNGTSVFAVWEEGGQYIEQPYPADSNKALDDDTSYFFRASFHPSLSLFLRDPKTVDRYFRKPVTITQAEEVEWEGQPCVRLSGSARRDEDGPETPRSFWYSKKTGLLVRATQDTTASFVSNLGDDGDQTGGYTKGDADQIASAMWDLRILDVEIDKPIDPATFKPANDFEKVEDFGATPPDEMEDAEEDEVTSLLGGPAPAISGTLLDGGDFKLEALKGRIVVIDFWATWCPPCVASIPSIQKMSEKYADQPVTVIGINQDQGKTKVVQEFMRKKKITFAQVMDRGEIGNAYHITGIPTTLIIDKDGSVQYVHVGGSATIGDELGEKVDRLLKGEKLAAPAEKAAKKKAPAPPALDELAPERVREGTRSSVSVSPMGMRQGVTPDQSSELLLTSHQGEIIVVSGADASTKRIKLEGAGIGRVMIESVRRAVLNGKAGWLTAGQSFSGESSSSSITFYDEKGKKIWSFSPPLVKGTFSNVYFDVGDVLGDGVERPVVGYSTLSRSGRGGGNSAWLVILDEQGKPLITKKIGPSVYGLWIAEAPKDSAEKNKGRTIVVIDGSLRRFNLQRETIPATPTETETKP